MASPSKVPQNPIDPPAFTIATRAPLQESSTKDARCFGAAQINSSLHCWKRWYLIENDASIGYAPEWEHPSAYQGLIAAARQGLAAGKIWIHGSHAMTADGRPFVMSGFCFGRRYFLTCAHYLIDTSAEKREKSIRKMQNLNAEGIAISVSQTSEQMLKYRDGEPSYLSHTVQRSDTKQSADPSLRYAYLVSEHRGCDIAIFRIKDGEDDWEHTILPHQLALAAQHIWSYTFSVGYADRCRGQDQEKAYERFWEAMRSMLEAHPDRSLHQKFQDVIEKVSSSQFCPDSLLNLFPEQAGPPDFNQIFCPNRRAIAFGYVLNTGAPAQNHTQGHGGWRHHNVPVKGAEYDELPNRFVAFTPEIISWIRSIAA
ncbi:MAG: hypothetical protein Q9172_004746 [Xanthocarpia lactea]